MSEAAIKAGKAFVEISADNGPLKLKLREVSSSLRAWGESFSSFGELLHGAAHKVLEPLHACLDVFREIGDHLVTVSAKTGLSTEALSLLGYAAGQSESSVEALEAGLTGMAKFTAKAAGGNEHAAESLAKLGLTVSQFLALSPEEKFFALADGVAAVNDPTLRSAKAMELFGKAGAKLMPLLAQGSKGIKALMGQGKGLGLGVKKEDAEAADALSDAYHRLASVMTQIKVSVGAALAGSMTQFINLVTLGVSAVAKWVDQNRGLIQTLALVAAVVSVAGGAFITFGGILSFVGMAVAVPGNHGLLRLRQVLE